LKFFLVALSSLLLILILNSDLTAQSEKTLVFVRGTDATFLDPHAVEDGESIKVVAQIFETLVTFKPGSWDVGPSLATKWTLSDDQLQWTFDLRQNVKFHDGSPFNADAVVFSFQRRLDENHVAHKTAILQYQSSFSDLESVKKTGEYQVQFTLKHPSAPFLNNISMSAASIISPVAWKRDLKTFHKTAVGTGPWKFTSWTRDQKIVLTKNKNYWGKASGNVTRLIFVVIPESQNRLNMVARGEAQLADNFLPDHIQVALNDPKVTVVKATGSNTGYLSFNMDQKTMNNKKLRQAMSHAIKMSDLTKVLLLGYAETASTLLPPSIWGGDPSIKPYAYDLEKAKKLLAEAGYPDGLNLTLSIGDAARPYLPSFDSAALQVQGALKKIGIDVEIHKQPWTNYLTFAGDGKHEMALLGWSSDNGDPDNFLWPLLSIEAAKKPAGNISFYKNKEVTQWLIEARGTTDVKERTKLYHKALKQIHEDVPLIPIAHSEQLVLKAKTVSGFTLHPNGIRAMPDLHIAEAASSGAPASADKEKGKAGVLIIALIVGFCLIVFLYSRPRQAS
jgi:peptide/nickel transport system substrate-binding protein